MNEKMIDSMDNEIQAMSSISTALADLDDDTKGRVLRWAAERYGVAVPAARRADPPEVITTDENQNRTRTRGGVTGEPTFSDFVDLFDAVDPKNDIEKALTGAYWLQIISKQPSWQSLRVNNLLKDTGHGLANVTATLRVAQGRKPALVRQMAKSGKAAQAWKTYKLTTSGVALIRGKLGLTGAVPAAMVDHDEDQD